MTLDNELNNSSENEITFSSRNISSLFEYILDFYLILQKNCKNAGSPLTHIEVSYKETFRGKVLPGTTNSISRQKVYTILKQRAQPLTAEKICQTLDKKFPSKLWGEQLPTGNILAYLITTHLQDLEK